MKEASNPLKVDDVTVYENPDKETLVNIFNSETDLKTLVRKHDNKGGFVEYFNLACATDIETTSITQGDNKFGIAYAFTFGIGRAIICCRTWEQYLNIFRVLQSTLNLSEGKRIICFIHNLSFEFGYFIKRFKWASVFATDKHRPLKALTEYGVEFHCSARISGTDLKNAAKTLTKHDIAKRMGDLDYRLVRHSGTPLTDKEKMYNVADVQILLYWADEKMEQDGDITKIPLTNTGYVREYLRKHTTYLGSTKEQRRNNKEQKKYRKLIKTLTLEPEEYDLAQDVKVGGFVHANALNCDRIFDKKFLQKIAPSNRKVDLFIKAADFTSSYPAVLCMDSQFPMSKGHKVDVTSVDDNFERYLSKYCCMFYATFTNLESTFTEHYIPKHKCLKLRGYTENNNKIMSADYVVVPCTEISFRIIQKIYKWDSCTISDMWIYQKGYLPKLLIEGVLKLYCDKTTLKGVKGSEVEYMRKKGMANASYGMMVTEIVNDEISLTLDDDTELWKSTKSDIKEELEKYNKSTKRFLFYLWGIWICYLAQWNLWTAILELGGDRLYSDTDSVKYIDLDGKHQKYFEEYNRNIDAKIDAVCAHYDIPREMYRPKTIKGKEKPLGYWDKEDDMTAFKTLGAKRYMYEITEKEYKTLHLTMSGVNNKKGLPYMLDKSGIKYYGVDVNGNKLDVKVADNIEKIYEYRIPLNEDTTKVFDLFSDGLYFPTGHSGKLAHVYNETEQKGTLTDYLGNTAEYDEYTSVWLGELDFTLGVDETIIDIINSCAYYHS